MDNGGDSYIMQQHVEQFDEDELLRYSRQILLSEWDLEAQHRLKQSTILIIGAGGIGCTSAQMLARAGVGKLIIIDPDHIELSNLQRQTAFNDNHLGRAKVKVLAEQIQKVNSRIEVWPLEQAFTSSPDHMALVQQADLVLDGCDNFETRYVVNQLCVMAQKPLLSASAIGFEGQLGLFLPQHGCYACLFGNAQPDQAQRCADSGVLATTPNVIASLQAHHALLYVGMKHVPLANRLLVWHGLTGQQRLISFNRDQSCLICGEIEHS